MIKRSKHFIHIRDRRYRKAYIKVSLAYGGALLMTLDAACSIFGPMMFPHMMVVLDHPVSAAGKIGASFSGLAVFFDRIVEAAIEEIEAA
jgi:hypothetical protein